MRLRWPKAIAARRAGSDWLIALAGARPRASPGRSEEHTYELQSLMRISYAVFCLKKKKQKKLKEEYLNYRKKKQLTERKKKDLTINTRSHHQRWNIDN